MRLGKGPEQPDNYRRGLFLTRSARSAFAVFLRAMGIPAAGRVLLPGYIGWSPREGSGVFDPLRELGATVGFYRLDRRLRIDVDHVEKLLRATDVAGLVLIHYFGVPDPRYEEVAKLARARGVWILEDEAHAWLTDLVAGKTGRLGDACLWSLHKMLPVASGGALVVNGRLNIEHLAAGPESTISPLEFDLFGIADIRRRNAARLTSLLAGLEDHVEPLWPDMGSSHVPQSYPVLVKKVSRNSLYHRLNGEGFGVVSLYHTLIEEIPKLEFGDTYWVSGRILNLPVHQDVVDTQLVALVRALENAFAELG
jgi:dTDP-4-amino-4,6-dideoxygalactose transaminase